MPRKYDPFLLISISLTVAVTFIALAGSTSWINKPFPGFLLLENRVIASASVAGWPATRTGEIYQHEIVTVDGQPFRNKHYLTYDDAVSLRDVLVSTGMCRQSQNLRRCAVRSAGGGLFAVHRGGVNFHAKVSFATYEAALEQVKALVSAKLCYLE